MWKGNFNSSVGRQFFLAVAIVLFTMTFFWRLEQNPLARLLFTQEFMMHESSDSSKALKPKNQSTASKASR